MFSSKLPLLLLTGYLNKCTSYVVEKKGAYKFLILHETHDPEGQRFKSSPRNQPAKLVYLLGWKTGFVIHFSVLYPLCFLVELQAQRIP